MSHRRRRRVFAWVLAILSAFAVGALLSWLLSSSTSERIEGAGSGPVDDPQTSFDISGDLEEPVSPGVLVPLNLSLTNPFDEPLSISDLRVTVESVDAPHATTRLPCTTDDFVVEQFDSKTVLLVQPGETLSLAELDVARVDWPRVGMVDADWNQDGCKAATLVLSYTASGRTDA